MIKVERLKKRREFLAVAATKTVTRTPTMRVQLKQRTLSPLRVGFTVVKRLGNAVVRNRMRRRLRAAVSHALLGKPCSSYDLVIIATPQTLTDPFLNLCRDFERVLERIA